MSLNNKIILACILVFVFSSFLPPSIVVENFFFSLRHLENGFFHVMFTALFMHANFIHLLTNIMLLYIFGGVLEELLGSRKFAFVFFVTGPATFLLSSLIYPSTSMFVGASGAIFSIMAVTTLINPLSFKISRPYKFIFGRGGEMESELLEEKLSRQSFFLDIIVMFLIQITIISLYDNLAGSDNVGHIGHFLGLLIGFLIGITWSPTWRVYARTLGSASAVMVVLFIISGYSIYAVNHFFNPQEVTFVDELLRSFGITLFKSARESCTEYCIARSFDFGSFEDNTCSCTFNQTVDELIV